MPLLPVVTVSLCLSQLSLPPSLQAVLSVSLEALDHFERLAAALARVQRPLHVQDHVLSQVVLQFEALVALGTAEGARAQFEQDVSVPAASLREPLPTQTPEDTLPKPRDAIDLGVEHRGGAGVGFGTGLEGDSTAGFAIEEGARSQQ